MPTRRRLDVELVRRHLARSREHAQDLISDGVVVVDGFRADKPSRQVDQGASIVVAEGDRGDWVSRGAHKLLGAIDAFADRGLAVDGRVCVDAGASTGGFTQVLLSQGATWVHAIDVGYGQLAWQLRNDERVHVMERVNIKDLQAGDLQPAPSLAVADLSFISLRMVLPVLVTLVDSTGDVLVMVKPQFEVGRENVGAGGVVREPALRVQALQGVADTAAALGWPAIGVTPSVLPGPSGNVEYFLWLRHAPTESPVGLADFERAVQEGPQ